MQYGEEDGQYGGFRPRNRFGNNDRFRPVRVGEELDVTIESVGEKGDGVAKKKGFVIFVPGTQQGDTVRVRITKVFRKMAFAEVVGEAQSTPEEEPSEQPAEETEPEAEGEEQPAEEPVQDGAEDSEEF